MRENSMNLKHLRQDTINRTTRTETVRLRSQRATPVPKEPSLLKNISHLSPFFVVCCHVTLLQLQLQSWQLTSVDFHCLAGILACSEQCYISLQEEE